MLRTHLQNALLILDVLHLLQPDGVLQRDDLEGEELGGGLVAAQAHPGKGACTYCQARLGYEWIYSVIRCGCISVVHLRASVS